MKHTELKENDIVVFKRYCDIYEKETFEDGSVISVDAERKTVTICWLEGYKSRVDEIEFSKVIAKADESGDYMTFWCIMGNSILLEQEEEFKNTLMLGASNTGKTTLLTEFVCFEYLEYSKIVIDVNKELTDMRDKRHIPKNVYIVSSVKEAMEKAESLNDKFILVVDDLPSHRIKDAYSILDILDKYKGSVFIYATSQASLTSCVINSDIADEHRGILGIEKCYILDTDSPSCSPRYTRIKDMSNNKEVAKVNITNYANFYFK